VITFILRSAALLAAVLAPLHGAYATTAAPAIHFFDNSRFALPKLSPNGKYLAARVSQPGGRDRLSVVNLDDMSVKVVAYFSNDDIDFYQWVNDERLVFDTADNSMTGSEDRYGPGLYAVNRDGSDLKQLVSTEGGVSGTTGHAATGSLMKGSLLKWNNYLLRQPGLQNSDSVYVYTPIITPDRTVRHISLSKLNTVTGRATSVKGPSAVFDWMLDQNGEPRIAQVQAGGKNLLMYRDGQADDAPWRKLTETDAFVTDTFEPVGFGPDGVLYVNSATLSDKSSLYKLDMATGSIGKTPLVTSEEFDFKGELVVQRGKLLGIEYLADTPATAWLDPEMKTLQDTIDGMLPARVNQLQTPARGDKPWVLVTTYSDVEPESYLLYNKETKKLMRVGSANPHIEAATQGRQELVRYKARDGLEIPAWLTYPRGLEKKNLPLVVLVHGGPSVRGGSWGWDAEAQFLASRGYAVLQPEFRGSTGFGWKHFHAGWKQWGLAMQDDLADGAKWAVAKGLVDPNRICIAGGSYGGYAAMMGLVKDGDIFKCGINWAGVTDINLMYNDHWSAASDFTDRWKRFGMPAMVGDQIKDAAQFKATSPIEQAARIKRPVLLAYGGEDQRVPLFHGRKFHAALKAGNPDVEMVVYNKEGHGWSLPENRVDFWTRVEKFLDRNIGKK
jgi:dienelactone hydrolase